MAEFNPSFNAGPADRADLATGDTRKRPPRTSRARKTPRDRDPATDYLAHHASCPRRIAMRLAASGISQPCEHGKAVCDTCDRCTCGSYPSFR